MNKKAAIIAGVAIVGLIGAFALSGKNKQHLNVCDFFIWSS